jgi:hypothetical protein
VSYIEQNVFTFGTPTLMTSTKAVSQSFMSQGDHLNICCFPNICFYTLFYSL